MSFISPQDAHAYLESAVASLTLNNYQLVKMIESFKDEVDLGLERHWMEVEGEPDPPASSLMMIDSCIDELPTGQEKGVTYSMDVGGSNIRVAQVQIHGAGCVTLTQRRTDVTPNLMDPQTTATEFFDILAELVREEFANNDDVQHRLDSDGNVLPGKRTPVGLTFSFPMEQYSRECAVLSRWTKGWQTARATADPIEGRDVVKLMNDALARNRVPAFISVCINDTIATQVTADFESKGQMGLPCPIGMIIGTGFNVSYTEPRFAEFHYTSSMINMECGNFNRNLPQTKYDEALDALSVNPGVNRLEKMISGKYLCPLVSIILEDIYNQRRQLNPFAECNFTGAQMASMVRGGPKDLLSKYGIPESANQDDVSVLQTVVKAVFMRSASLSGAVVAAVYEMVGQEEMPVGVDGSLFRFNSFYRAEMARVLEVSAVCHVI